MSSSRPRRRWRGLVVTLVILAGLAFAADRVAESLAEGRLAEAAAKEAAEHDVRAASTSAEVGGYAFLPQVVRGEFGRITLDMERPTVSGVAAEDLTVVMSGITVPREMMTGGSGAARVDSTELKLRLSPGALTQLARSGGLEGMTLRIVDGKLQARVNVRGFEAVATVRPQVRGGRIGLIVDNLPDSVPARIREAVSSRLASGIKVPELPFRASVKQVAVDGQTILLTAAAADVELSTA